MPEPQFDPGAVQAVPYEPEFDPSSIVAVPFEPTVGGFDPSSVKAEPYLGPRGGFFNELFLGTKAGEPQTRRLLAGYLEKELTKYGLNYAVPSLANWARNVQEASAKEAAKYTPRVADFQDIHNGRDFLDWLGFAVGENAVNLGLATVAADITGAFGAGFGGVPGAAVGAAIGAAFISKILNEGEFYANLVAAGVDKHKAIAAADTTGQLAAALDAVVPYKTAYGTFWKPAKKIGKGVARSAARAAGRKIVGTVAGVAKGAAAGFLEEGATEVGQDILQMASKSALVDKYSMMTPESAAQLFNTFMAAGFTGAGFRGGGSLIEQMRGPEPSIGFSNPRTGRNKPPPQVLDLVVQAEGPQTEWVPRREALEGAPAVVREEIPIKGLLEAPKPTMEEMMAEPVTEPGEGGAPITSTALTNIPGGKIVEAVAEHVAEPSPREQEYPPDVTALTDVVMKGVTKLEKQHPPTEPPEPPPPAPSSVGFAKEQGPPSVQNELDQFGLFEKWAMTPLQNAEANQHIPGVRNYMGRVEQWTGESTIQTRKGDVLLQNWDLLGVDQANRLGRFLIDTTIASQKAGRRFTPVELLERSQGKDFKLNEQAFTLWQQIDQQFQDWLDEYRKIAFEKIQNSDAHPSIKLAKIAELGKQFARLKSFHYFPIMRFGKHVLRASDPKTGWTKWMESYRTRRERDKRYAEFAAEFEPQGLKVATDTLTDTQYSLMGFPPGLMDMLETKLDLDADQRKALHDIYLNWLPGKSFLKHMMKRRLVGGFSEDARRAFASYTQSISNFLARMKHGEELLKAVQDVERSYGMLSGPRAHLRREIAADLERHRQYIMNPGSELGAIRSGMFQWFFSYVPKQVVVNFTQIPLLTYPHLAAAAGPVGIGDVKATIAITKAIKDMFYIYDWRHGWRGKLDQYQRLSEKKQAMIARAVDEQFLNEGMFAHVAGYALGNPLTRYLPLPDPIGDPAGRVSKIVRAGLEFGVLPFQTSEDANRRITFVAALDIAEGLGMDDEQAYQFAKNSVRKTQGEYAQWNRPRLMRGKKSAYFIFKTFLQFSLHFGFTAPGRGRFWLMMLAMGGYLGLPGAEDLLDALSGMGNWLKRHFQFKGDPRTDLEEDLATMMRSMRQDPDAWAHGLGRTTFGYGSLGKMWGIPVPQLDFSSSLQMGRVVPGVKPMRNLLEGGDWATNAARFMAEWIGPGGTLGYTMGRSLVDDSPGSIQWMRVFSPRAVAQITNWWEAGHPVPFGSHIGMEWKGGATTNSRGQKIVEYDPNDIEQELEIFGMLMGVASARLARKRDVSWAQSEASNYYNTLREMLFQAASRAKDREAKAAVKRRVDWFNNNAPPGARITNKELIESVRRRGKTEKLREDSLPTQKRWVQLYKDIEEAYSPPSQP